MRELRCIVFSETELLNAIIERRRQSRESLPVGTIRGVTFSRRGGVSATLVVVDDYGEDRSVKIPVSELAAALVSYCIERKIPMPRHSTRSLEVIDGAVTLLLELSDKAAPGKR